MNRKTGYYSYTYDGQKWHRNLNAAITHCNRSNNWFYRELSQVVDIETNKTVWGIPQ